MSAATIALISSLRMMLRHWPSAWTWLSTVLMPVERRALRRHQLMLHRQEPLGDDVQARTRHQVMDVGDAAGDRVLDRDHAERGLAACHRGEGILEGRARHRLVVGIGLAAGEMRVRAGLALKEIFFLVMRLRYALRSRRVNASAMAPIGRIPAPASTDRARACGARFRGPRACRRRAAPRRRWRHRCACRLRARAIARASRAVSSGEGGSATKRSSAARR